MTTPELFSRSCVIAVAWDLRRESQRPILAPGGSMPNDIYDIEAIGPAGAFSQVMTQEASLAEIRLMAQGRCSTTALR
jgi:hypothetical protein